MSISIVSGAPRHERDAPIGWAAWPNCGLDRNSSKHMRYFWPHMTSQRLASFVQAGLSSFGVRTDIMGHIILTSLRADSALSTILGPICREKWFVDRLKVCKTPPDYADELQKIVDLLSKHSARGSSLNAINGQSCEFANWLIESLRLIGYETLVSLNNDFSRVTLRSVDKARREHHYTIHFVEYNGINKPTVETSLPSRLDFQWRGDGSPVSLTDIVNAMDTAVESLQPFFKVRITNPHSLCMRIFNISSFNLVGHGRHRLLSRAGAVAPDLCHQQSQTCTSPLLFCDCINKFFRSNDSMICIYYNYCLNEVIIHLLCAP